jgi:hypothetical protein
MLLGAHQGINMTPLALVASMALAGGTALCICCAVAADLPTAPSSAPTTPVAYAPQALQTYGRTGFYLRGHVGAGYKDGEDAHT